MMQKPALNYVQNGDYLIPEIEYPEQPTRTVGRFGELRRNFLRENRKSEYQRMKLEGTLKQHLLTIDDEAEVILERVMNWLLENDPAPDKATDQLGWVRHMNALKYQAEEIVIADVVLSS